VNQFGVPPKAPDQDETEYPGTGRHRSSDTSTIYGRGEYMTGPDIWLHSSGEGWTKYGTVDRVLKLTHPQHGTFIKVVGLPLAPFAMGFGCSGEEVWVLILSGGDFEGSGRIASTVDFTDVARKGDTITYEGGSLDTLPLYVATEPRPKGIRNVIE